MIFRPEVKFESQSSRTECLSSLGAACADEGTPGFSCYSCEKPGVVGAVRSLPPASEGFGSKSLLETCFHDKGFPSRAEQALG